MSAEPSARRKVHPAIMILGVLGGGCLLLILLVVGGCALMGVGVKYAVEEVEKQEAERRAAYEKAAVSSISWAEIEPLFGPGSSGPLEKKVRLWKKYRGKKVKWSGTVKSVESRGGKVQVEVEMKGRYTGAILVGFRKDQSSRVMKYRRGDNITFVAMLDEWGNVIAYLGLKYAEAVNDLPESRLEK